MNEVYEVKKPESLADKLKTAGKYLLAIGLIIMAGVILKLEFTTGLIITGAGVMFWIQGDRMNNPEKYVALAKNMQGMAKGIREASNKMGKDTKPLQFRGSKSSGLYDFKIGPPKVS